MRCGANRPICFIYNFLRSYYNTVIMRNVEIKARVRDLARIIALAKKLSNSNGEVIQQEDTFYNCNSGRLKFRRYVDNQRYYSTLVRYEREDEDGPTLSDYDLLHFTADEKETSDVLSGILSRSLGIKGCLQKERLLFMVDQTRIHIDKVKNLGDFMELEVVLDTNQTEEDGLQIATSLMEKLEVIQEDLINCAYIDLLLKENT